MDWSYVFVVILSVLLVLFLITAGVLIVMFVRVTRQIQHLSGSAQQTVRSFRAAIRQAGSNVRAMSAVSLALKKLSSLKRKGPRASK